MRKLKAIGSEIKSYFKISPAKAIKARESVIEALRESLELRIRAAQDVNIVLDDTSFIGVESFNIGAPDLSVVTYKEFEMTLKELPKFLHKNYEDNLAKDVKGAYVSFYRDYGDLIASMQLDIQGKTEPPKPHVDAFFLKLKRASKLAYRILKLLFDVGFVTNTVYQLVTMNAITEGFAQLGVTPDFFDVSVLTFANFSFLRITKAILNIAEGFLRRSGDNLREFDRLVGDKRASSYSQTARFVRQIEQYC